MPDEVILIVGAAGSGAHEMLGVASTVIDGGGEIGQSVGAQGSVIVNGGEWTNNGLLNRTRWPAAR